MNKKIIDVGSDFCGVGAFDQALMRLGIQQNKVFACDMDKYARQTYVHNYGNAWDKKIANSKDYKFVDNVFYKIFVDTKNPVQPTKEEIEKAYAMCDEIASDFYFYFPWNVYNRRIPEKSLDIYMTSPPCQAFSLAGRRKGESDKRGILFYNSHEFIKENKPRYFIFENVKGLMSDAGGNTFKRWRDYLGGKSVNGNQVLFPDPEAVPYHIYYIILNAKDYDIPQNRERVFIVGIRDDEDNNFTWPKKLFLTKRLRDVLELEVDEKYFLSGKILNWFDSHTEKNKSKGNGFSFKPKTENDIANSVNARYHKMGIDDTYIQVVSFGRSEEEKKRRREHRQKTGEDSGTFKDKQLIFKDQQYYDTILANPNPKKEGLISIERNIRRLTPRECFRLQDFPDSFNWTVSDTQAYKQAGNSIAVGVLAAIISKFRL